MVIVLRLCLIVEREMAGWNQMCKSGLPADDFERETNS